MKAKCISNKDNKFFGCDKNSPFLEIGKEYIVKDIIVHSWHTEIYLEGFDVPFNSMCFEIKNNSKQSEEIEKDK